MKVRDIVIPIASFETPITLYLPTQVNFGLWVGMESAWEKVHTLPKSFIH